MSSSTSTGRSRANPIGVSREFTVKDGISSLYPQLPPKQTNVKLLSAAKWCSAFILFAVVLSCAVVSKMSVVMLAHQYQYYNITNGTKKLNETPEPSTQSAEEKSKAEIFVVFVLMLMIPEGFGFVRAAWLWTFRSRDETWPSRPAVVWCFVGSTLEVVGLCYFVVVVSTVVKLPPDLYVIVLCGVFLFPTIWSFISKIREQRCSLQVVLLVVAIVLNIAGYSGVMFLIWKFNNPDPVHLVLVPLSLIFISIAWSPNLRELQVKIPSHPTGGAASATATSQAPVSKEDSARNKATFIMTSWKLLIIPFVSAAFASIFSVTDIKSLKVKDHLGVYNNRMHILTAHVCSSLVGYLAGVLACQMRMQHVGFALPLVFVTPVCVVMAKVHKLCDGSVLSLVTSTPGGCMNTEYLWIVISAAVVMWGSQLISVCSYIMKNPLFTMLKEARLFWIPNYNSIFVEQFMLLNRKDKLKPHHLNLASYQDTASNSQVFICSSMWHETEQEMKDFLLSLNDLDKKKKTRAFESHVFVDGGIEGSSLQNYALQLMSLLNMTLGIKPEDGLKISTPYGMQLRWDLQEGMPFYIHLKDNQKVKSKKRWSQIMLMSYILDFKQCDDCNTFLMMTDGDVKFSAETVEVLLNEMVTDVAIGAASGRVCPLGSGPVVWYQEFEYCVTHWLNKVANHIFGTMAFSSGCLTMYRAEAVRNVLRLYSTNARTPTEFLARDMGEELWLSALLVQAGWKLIYCPASIIFSYCPDGYDEFFHQRRRWISSMMANLLQIVKQWKTCLYNNQSVNIVYIVYQFMVACNILLSPGTVVLVIGLLMAYAKILDFLVVAILLTLLVIVYMLICLVPSQKVQLFIPKLFTFVFAVVVALLLILVLVKAAQDIQSVQEFKTVNSGTKQVQATTSSSILGESVRLQAFTVYLLSMVGITLVSALLHPMEAYYLIYCIWYLMCMPSGAVTLIIFTMFNIDDTSWGTREEKVESPETWRSSMQYLEKLKWIFRCCRGETPSLLDAQVDLSLPTEETELIETSKSTAGNTAKVASTADKDKDETEGQQDRTTTLRLPNLTTEEWLTIEGIQFKQYVHMFVTHGYDDVSFIAGMTEKDLHDIGIRSWAHRQRLMEEIRRIPKIEIKMTIPEDVEEWLVELGLEMYWTKCQELGFTTDEKMIDFRHLKKEEVKDQLEITKTGHLNKMMKAMQHLYYPDETHRRLVETRKILTEVELKTLSQVNDDDGAETLFWEELQKICLSPVFDIFNQGDEMKKKLRVLKEFVVMIFSISNIIWLAVVFSLYLQLVPDITATGSNTLMFFLITFGLLPVLQFIALLWYRLWTVCSYLAKVPWFSGHLYQNWAFEDNRIQADQTMLLPVNVQVQHAVP